MLISSLCNKSLNLKLPIRMRPAFMVMAISLLYSGVSFCMPKRSIEDINKNIPERCQLRATSRTNGRVHFKCICGNVVSLVNINNILIGKHISCGCVKSPLLNTYSAESANGKRPINSLLTVVKIYAKSKNNIRCICDCRCGGKADTTLSRFLSGYTKSCGCLRGVVSKKNNTLYFPHIRTIYATYKSMMNRCNKPEDPQFQYYGGKGVAVCDEWQENYQHFLDWSLQNGWNESLELDKDIRGDGLLYSPETCMWVTHKRNMQSLSSAKKYFYSGENRSMAEISVITNIPKSSIYSRMKCNKTLQQAIDMGQPRTKYYKKGLKKTA